MYSRTTSGEIFHYTRFPSPLQVVPTIRKTFNAARITLPPVKRALLIGIEYSNTYHPLRTPYNDIVRLKALLKHRYDFSDDDISLLTDREGTPPHQLPTKENILNAITALVQETSGPNSTYVFAYSGHSHQRKATQIPSTEEDGLEEYIIPLDAFGTHEVFERAVDEKYIIADWELNNELVQKVRKRKGAQLVAFFDSCHSGTLLNLRHFRCNRVGDIRSFLSRAGRACLIEPINQSFNRALQRRLAKTSSSCDADVSQAETLAAHVPQRRHIDELIQAQLEEWGIKPHSRAGEAYKLINRFGRAPVICISACKDSQVTLETDDGRSMLSAISKLLENNPNPTYEVLMTAVSINERTTREDCIRKLNDRYYDRLRMDHGENLPEWMLGILASPENRAWRKMQKLVLERGHPQISSLKPLIMKQRFAL